MEVYGADEIDLRDVGLLLSASYGTQAPLQTSKMRSSRRHFTAQISLWGYAAKGVACMSGD